MDHAEGMSVALDSVIVHPAWVRENPFSPSIKDVGVRNFLRKLMECLDEASWTEFHNESITKHDMFLGSEKLYYSQERL